MTLTVSFDLAPTDAIETTKDDPHRCWECAFYSFKVYGGQDSSSGKCFRDHDKVRKVYYVDGLMKCPGFKLNETGYEGH